MYTRIGLYAFASTSAVQVRVQAKYTRKYEYSMSPKSQHKRITTAASNDGKRWSKDWSTEFAFM